MIAAGLESSVAPAVQAHDGKSGYRPDIDGLRAIAVLAVVLFHIDPALLPGGFVGVDIFFVISGFLITGNIVKDLRSAQGFSWAEFYRRRMLRILPVLSVVMLTVLVLGQFVLLPEDLRQLGYSSLAAVFSAANLYFTYFLDTSYFADDSSLQPLLHLWSLGVEEQFYLLWPLLLVALFARLSSGYLLVVVLLLAGASFALAEGLLATRPMFAYYMLPSRAGELLIGALLAIWLGTGRPVAPAWLAAPMGMLGGGLIAASLAWITEDMGFPGINALPATLGAALLIWAGHIQPGGISRLLAWRPMVLVGLVSYSLYLWHWPVLAFYRYVYGSVAPLAGVLLFGLMLLLSIASYRWVEKPCRHLRWNFGLTLAGVGLTSAAMISAVCLGLLLSRGYGVYGWNQDYRAALQVLEPAPPANKFPYVCQRAQLSEKELLSEACIINARREPAVLLWGDSNAAHYVGVLGAFAEAAGFSFRNAAHSSCPPLLEGAAATQKPDRLAGCLASIEVVKQHLDPYSTVILGAAWDSYFRRSPGFSADLQRTVDDLVARGKRVILLGQVPGFRDFNRKCLQKALKLPMVQCAAFGRQPDGGDSPANLFLAELAKSRPGVGYFNVRDALCRQGECSAYHEYGELLYFDRAHLSMVGSWKLGRDVLASQGLPEAFAHLASSVPSGDRQNLELSLLTRGQEAFDSARQRWQPLPLNMGSADWRGSAYRDGEAGDSIRLADQRSNAFESISRRLPQSELQALLAKGDTLTVRAELAGCADTYPMLRIRTWVGEVQTQYDLILDCDGGRIKTKGALEALGANLQVREGIFTVQARRRLSPATTALEITLFPASGTRFGSYDVQATGTLEVKDIALAVSQAP